MGADLLTAADDSGTVLAQKDTGRLLATTTVQTQ